MTGSKRTSIKLQERDLRLIEALEGMRVINREQAKVVAGFHSTTRANARLLALTQAGLLKRVFLGDRQGVYWLRSAELQRMRRRGDSMEEPTGVFWRHQLEINRVQLLVQYNSIPVQGWWFGCWRSFQRPLSAAIPLIPDGYFELGSTQGLRSVFVEVDLGTEAILVLAKKANLYVQLAASGEFSQTFGRSQFRVLVVTTTERRLQDIRRAVAKITDRIFWLGTLDLVSSDRFWNASWFRPSGDQLQSIL